jgi:hypothetical protein
VFNDECVHMSIVKQLVDDWEYVEDSIYIVEVAVGIVLARGVVTRPR